MQNSGSIGAASRLCFGWLLLVFIVIVTTALSRSSAFAKPVEEGAQESHPLFRKLANRGPLSIIPAPLVHGEGKTLQVQTFGSIDFVKDEGSWAPTGAFVDHPLPQECTAEALDAQLFAAGADTYQWSRAAGDFFSKCEDTLSLGHRSDNLVLLDMESMQYQMQIHPHIREAHLTLDDGTKIHGFLALKPNRKPRPLIIVKCGLFCDSQPDWFFKFLTMHLFDESPFHLLILESITSPSFARHNQRLGVGGIEEGRHVVEVAKLLQTQTALAPFISSVHTISPSLGGHAALYASLYNTHHPLPNGRPALSSAMALCPVVNLENSFADLFTGLKRDFLFTRMIRSVLGTVFHHVDGLSRRYQPSVKLSEEQLQDLLIEANLDFYRSVSPDFFWYPFAGPAQSRDDLWERNDFVRQLPHFGQTPTLVVAAQDDWVVRSEHNSDLLEQSGAVGPGSPINMLKLSYGSHCAFSVSYGWPQIGTLLRNYILSHSRTFAQQGVWRRTPLQLERPLLRSGEKHMQQFWQIDQGRDHFTLNMKIWQPQDPMIPSDLANSCRNESRRFYSGNSCFRYQQAKVPLALISKNLRPPQNTAEAQSLTRWANVRLKLMTQTGRPAADTTDEPYELRWQDFAEW